VLNRLKGLLGLSARTNISTEPFSRFSTRISPDEPGEDMPETRYSDPHCMKRVSWNVAQAVEG
jgi:hypothetical protein